MAQHIRLSKTDEPEAFRVIGAIKNSIIEKAKTKNEFTNFQVWFEGKPYTVLVLSKNYVRNPNTEKAFTVREFTLEQNLGDDQWLAKRCPLEVHLTVSNRVLISGIFWVV